MLEEADSGRRQKWKAIALPEHNVQKTLGPVEIARCQERHNTAPLGIRREPMKSAKDSFTP